MLSSLKASTNVTTSVVASLLPSTGSPLPSTIQTKQPLKVSFRDRVKAMQSQDSKQTSSSSTSSIAGTHQQQQQIDRNKEQIHATVSVNSNGSNTSNSSASGKCTKPSSLSLKEKVKSVVGITERAKSEELPSSSTKQSTSIPLRPWSKLKLATISSGGSSYASGINETGILPKIRIAKIKPTTSSAMSCMQIEKIPINDNVEKHLLSPNELVASTSKRKRNHVERICISDSEIKKRTKPKFGSTINNKMGKTKIYRSVDDLSPEYSGLPFVKKLKILNERQKIAELESKMIGKSFSLDYPDDQTNIEPLIRSQSEGSGMIRNKLIINNNIAPIPPLNKSQQNLQIPISPESNETMERRQLKSILKKLSEDKLSEITATIIGGQQQQKYQQHQQPITGSDDYTNLLRAQTVEGYVARHSKFMKSVTFDSTLSSPPQSAHTIIDAIDERNTVFFPIIGAQTSTTTTAEINYQQQQLQQQQQQKLSPQLHQLSPTSLTHSDNSFLLDDSTNNRLQDIDSISTECDDKMTTKSLITKKLLKGNF